MNRRLDSIDFYNFLSKELVKSGAPLFYNIDETEENSRFIVAPVVYTLSNTQNPFNLYSFKFKTFGYGEYTFTVTHKNPLSIPELKWYCRVPTNPPLGWKSGLFLLFRNDTEILSGSIEEIVQYLSRFNGKIRNELVMKIFS